MAGPLVATLLLSTLTLDLRTVFILSIIPAFFCVFILFRGVTDITGERAPARSAPKLRWKVWNRRFKYFLFIIILFTLGNSSDSFIILLGQNHGLSVLQIMGMLMTFNAIYALLAGPLGSLSDRIGRRKLMLAGWTVYGLVYIGFALSKEASPYWADEDRKNN
jgi:MFS family permease